MRNRHRERKRDGGGERVLVRGRVLLSKRERQSARQKKRPRQGLEVDRDAQKK